MAMSVGLWRRDLVSFLCKVLSLQGVDLTRLLPAVWLSCGHVAAGTAGIMIFIPCAVSCAWVMHESSGLNSWLNLVLNPDSNDGL